jgi:hypothetical protein
MEYAGSQLDREVVAPDQIRTVIRTFKENLFTDLFPGRTEVPKTLIFAKDDSHAEDIVHIVREEFGKGNEFCKKITYKTTGDKPEDLIASFRNSYNPRIAVTLYSGDFTKGFAKLLEISGVSRYQISSFAHLDQAYLSKLKSGEKNNPSPEVVMKICLGIAYHCKENKNVRLHDFEALFNSVGRSLFTGKGPDQ